jgi:NADH dehydrogenase
MTMDTKIVIVGAGYAGILTAKKLARRFRKVKSVSITIIDKNPFHTMLTELHEVAAGRVDEGSIRIPLKRVFAGRKVDVKQDLVTQIDFENKTVVGKNERYEYDYLVLCAGSKPTYFGVNGAKEHAFTLWSYEDAIILKDRIPDMFRKAAGELDEEEKKRLLTFHIVGAGFTGVEMAGELAEYVPILCDKYEIDREIVSISVIDVLDRTVPTMPPKLSAKVERRLNRMGVRVLLKTRVVSIGEDFIEFGNGNEPTREKTGTVIWAAGIESADITEKAARELESAERGRIKLDRHLRSVDSDRVYVAGDNMHYIPPGEEHPVPQVVENCEQSAAVVAHNIVCAVTGKGKMKEYDPKFHGIMVSLGGRHGVAHVGTANRKVSLPSFFAMFVKHFINLVYFVQLLGWNKVFSYLKKEFFTIRNRRSFVGGHLSNRTPSFLLMPLRVWLGAVWVFEGIKKILEGWFVSPKLAGFFTGANQWYNNILSGTGGTVDGTSGATPASDAVGSATSAAADAVSSATSAAADAVSSATSAVADAVSSAASTVADAVSSATSTVADAVSSATAAAADAASAATPAAEAVSSIGKAIINFDFLGLFRVLFVSGKDPLHSTLNDYAFKLDVPLVNSFINDVILPNEGLMMFMQIFIVLAEILIGLALIGGLFTTPASAGSLVLQAMFVTTTGLYLSTFWMVFAGIAVLVGGGRVLGLDYYVMPVLKRKWKSIKCIRKWYLYND